MRIYYRVNITFLKDTSQDAFFFHTTSCASSANLADFFARKDLPDYLLEALPDFLSNGFAHSVCNILSYLNITNLPILFWNLSIFTVVHFVSISEFPERPV
jgi:hypothetical protein